MATGRDTKITGQIGEYLASAELGRRGYIVTTFAGNVPDFDVLAVNQSNETLPIQVKTIRHNTWQFNATTFLDISFEQKGDVTKQTVKAKKKLANPELLCIFIRLVAYGRDEFYIFQWKDLQDIIDNPYREMLKKHNGVRPRNSKSKHTAISTKDLKQFKDNWKLIDKCFE